MTVKARFTKIELPPMSDYDRSQVEAGFMSQPVYTTLQDEMGETVTLKHPDYVEFCRTAIPLVSLPHAVVDTDQLIGHWFDLPTAITP